MDIEYDYDLSAALEVSKHQSGAIGGAAVEPKFWLHGDYMYGEPDEPFNDSASQPFEVISYWNEDWEGSHYWLIELQDGRHLFIDASHDYTGWDCQAGGLVLYYRDYNAAVAALTADERKALGV